MQSTNKFAKAQLIFVRDRVPFSLQVSTEFNQINGPLTPNYSPPNPHPPPSLESSKNMISGGMEVYQFPQIYLMLEVKFGENSVKLIRLLLL